MSNPQADPWATVLEDYIDDEYGGRRAYVAVDVDEARAEMERRHAEEMKSKDDQIARLKALVESMHQPAIEAQLAATAQAAMLNRRAYLDAQDQIERLKAEHEAAMAAVGRSHAQALAKVSGELYWRGFYQATVNRPGSLSTAEDLVQVTKERDTLRAHLQDEQRQHGESLNAAVKNTEALHRDLSQVRGQLAAAQEKAEPCVWTVPLNNSYRRIAVCHSPEAWFEDVFVVDFQFCPYCGKPLTVEAPPLKETKA